MNLNPFDRVPLKTSQEACIDRHPRCHPAEVNPLRLRVGVPGKQDHRDFVDYDGVGHEPIIRALEIQQALL